MIGDAVFYLGAVSRDNETSEEIYGEERGTETCVTTENCEGETRQIQWTGKVGLMYSSDEYMVYGKGVNITCYDGPYECQAISLNLNDATTGWIYNTNIKEGQDEPSDTWLLSPHSDYSSNGTCVYSFGPWFNNNFVYDDMAVRPVVYLSSNVEIESGTGTELDPYVLKINNN